MFEYLKYVFLSHNLFIADFFIFNMNNLGDILKIFPNEKIVVVGDVMLDKTIFGIASRLSPEAPVPVLKASEEKYGPGGATNTAANISSLGGNVSLFGFVGKDPAMKILSSI